MQADPASLVLASRSPRRRRLLEAAGLAFEIIKSTIDESEFYHSHPRTSVMKTALAKAFDVADAQPAGTLVLGADTSVVIDGEILNKPASREHAAEMLMRLSGRTHEVMTGLALAVASGEAISDCVTARVTFNALSPELIKEWVDSGEGDDKAGAYGIQQLGRRFPASIDGDLTCVIGLPMVRLRRHLDELWARDPFAGRTERAIALEAYPDMIDLPEACLTFRD